MCIYTTFSVHAPSCPQVIGHVDPPTVFWLRQEQMDLLGNVLHSWSSQALTLLSLLPLKEILSWEGLSWHWAVPYDMSKLKLFFLPSSVYLFSDLLLQRELLYWTSELPQKYFHPWVVVNIIFLWEDVCWKFCHLADITGLSVFDSIHWFFTYCYATINGLILFSCFPISSLYHFYLHYFYNIRKYNIYIFSFKSVPTLF